MITRILPWVVASLVLTCAGARVACVQSVDADTVQPHASERAEPSPEAPRERAAPQLQPRTLVEDPPPGESAEPAPSRRSWCEPIEPLYCAGRDAICPPMEDGTPRVCRRPHLRPGGDFGCLPKTPSRDVQRMRQAHLLDIARAVKSKRPKALAKYLGVLAVRESSRRPWKRHRLSEDVLAAATAWGRRSAVFAASPAAGEPWRWREGLGLYGQNPSLWLDVWDASAEPETLCGEVESTLVHLRMMRKRWHRIANGYVDCDGAFGWAFTGPKSRGEPSWYDLSLVNSGSEACPAQPGEGLRFRKRLDFERRARGAGLDPHEGVSLAGLGEVVAVDEQDAFAEGLRGQWSANGPRTSAEVLP